jgi:hypothetical protein
MLRLLLGRVAVGLILSDGTIVQHDGRSWLNVNRTSRIQQRPEKDYFLMRGIGEGRPCRTFRIHEPWRRSSLIVE